MTITKTFEPLRPLYGDWENKTECYRRLFGGYRVFYGESHWPSHSYWLVPGDPEQD